MDRARILSRLDILENYLEKLNSLKPSSFGEYENLEKKMSCERLLHLLCETTIDICYLLVKELKLGLPTGDESAIEKLSCRFSPTLIEKLKSMKRFRNILVHRYEEINDRRIFEILQNDLDDFLHFKEEVLKILAEEEVRREGQKGF